MRCGCRCAYRRVGAASEPSLFQGDRTFHPRGTRLSPSGGGETTSLKDLMAHDTHRDALRLQVRGGPRPPLLRSFRHVDERLPQPRHMISLITIIPYSLFGIKFPQRALEGAEPCESEDQRYRRGHFAPKRTMQSRCHLQESAFRSP